MESIDPVLNTSNETTILHIITYNSSSFVGVDELDQALTLFLSSGIILGGVTGFILDNIIPGNFQTFHFA